MNDAKMKISHNIGSLNEKSLHSQIKDWYARKSDHLEVKVDSYVIDIIRDNLLIEIQTGNFSSIRDKLHNLTQNNRLRLVYPSSQLKWIVKLDKSRQNEISRRKSPKKGKLVNIFDELVRIPDLFPEKNLEIEVLLIESEDIRSDDGLGSWRRKGVSLIDNRLIRVIESVVFSNPEDFLMFIPDNVEKPFTNKSLSKASGINIDQVRKMTYCLRKMNAIQQVGKDGNALLFDIL